MLERVLAVASDIFQVPLAELRPESSPDTVESWDSLNHLNLIVALEQEFGIQFAPEEIEQLVSIDLAAALLEEKLLGGQHVS